MESSTAIPKVKKRITAREKYNKSETWQQKAQVVRIYHIYMLTKRAAKWGMKDTARYFGLSVGLVCDNIHLAKRIKEVEHFELRKDAYEFIRSHPIAKVS